MVQSAPKKYRNNVIRFLCYLDNEEFDANYHITQERMMEIQPSDVVRWFQFRAWGHEDPEPDEPCRGARDSSLEFWKKSISFLHPYQHVPWNPLAEQGNPTRSREVNDLIIRVRKQQVRGQGAPSKAKSPLTLAETSRTIDYYRSQNSEVSYFMPAFISVQWQLMARVDCVSRSQKMNVAPHDTYPNILLKAKLNWSKNVNEERDCPWQTFIGARNHRFCVLLNLAIFLDYWLEVEPTLRLSPYLFSLNDDFRIPEGGQKIKSFVSALMNDGFKEIGLVEGALNTTNGKKGTHSIRKGARTFARNNGCSKDDCDARGRWHDSGRVSNVYEDLELPFIDASVASKLCVDGPIAYVVKEDDVVTTEFIVRYVVPGIHAVFGRQVAFVLGKAIMWGIFDDEVCHATGLDANYVASVKYAYSHLPTTLEEGENPIERKTIILTNDQGRVCVTQVDNMQNDDDDGHQPQAQLGGGNPNHFQQLMEAVISNQHNQQHDLTDFIQQVTVQHQKVTRNLRQLTTTVSRISNNPLRRLARIAPNHQQQQQQPAENVPEEQPATVAVQDPPPVMADNAILSPTPRTLLTLWHEYQFGIGSNKAARLFTAQERGRCKHKYSRRKALWGVQASLIRAGLTAEEACERIYAVYGHGRPITQIINGLKRDIRDGNLHPSLAP